MTLIIRNTGPGNDYVKGLLGREEIWHLGGGSDTIVTGGRGSTGTGFVEVNSGVDFGVTDKIYNESLAGFGNPWVGGHVIVNGVAQENHIYHLGAVMDESRITLPLYRGEMVDGAYVMSTAKVPGLFAIHGRGSFDLGPTRIKSWDSRDGAQVISIAAESLEDVDVYRLRFERLDDDTIRLDSFDLHGHHVSPILDEQYLRIDFMHLQRPQQVRLDVDGPGYEAVRDAVEDWLAVQVDDGSLLLGM